MYDMELTTPSSKKKYSKVYKSIRYKQDDVVNLFGLFGISNLDKLDGRMIDLIDMKLVDYILKCILLDIVGKYDEDITSNAKTIVNLERSKITRAFQFFHPNSKKYSLIDLVLLIGTYKTPKLNDISILDLIVKCPNDRVLSLDLMIYVNKKSPSRYKSSIPVISNDEIIFEFIHQLLFGRDSSSITKRNGGMFLCIDTGRDIPESKIKDYSNVDITNRLVSNEKEILDYSSKLISYYNIDISDSVDIHLSSSSQSDTPNKRQEKRKAIPKAVRDHLWKKYFNDTMKGSCFCCNREIDFTSNYEAGHIIAFAKGGTDSIENLRPICKSCNKSMGTRNMDEYKSEYYPNK